LPPVFMARTRSLGTGTPAQRFIGEGNALPREFIMVQPGHSDDRTNNVRASTEGIMDQVAQTTEDMTDRAVGLVSDIGAAVRDRPYTTLAMAAGLAFAVGALWKMGHQRPPSRWEAWTARLPSGQDWLQRRWR